MPDKVISSQLFATTIRHNAAAALRMAPATYTYTPSEYHPEGRFSEQTNATLLGYTFNFVADSIDLGPVSVDGLYFDIYIGGLGHDHSPSGVEMEIALLVGSPAAAPYDGWHRYSTAPEQSPFIQPFWGEVQYGGPAQGSHPLNPWRPGPRPSGRLYLGIRGTYPMSSPWELTLRFWHAVAFRRDR